MDSVEFWEKTWSRPYERYNGHHRQVWDALLPYLHGRVVDLGCGPSVMYKGLNVDLTGVDWSLEALEEAAINVPSGKFLLEDVRFTSLPDASFDTVVLSGVLDYFENWDSVLEEARRLRAPGGKIVATLLNGFRGHDWTQYKPLVDNWYLFLE